MKVNIFDPFVSEDIIKKFGGSKVENFRRWFKIM